VIGGAIVAFPAEFSYANEDDFIQRFLIPLLNRLGFFTVVNYHGVQEYGRDLIFAEIDRFGHIRYHGLQAKYESSIGKSDSHGLVQDCLESFANPFKHPQTGASERISTFYAVNGGDISEPASTHFFNSLTQFGGNVRLVDGKSLVALDRQIAFSRHESIRELLTGLLLEVRFNRQCIQPVLQLLNSDLESPGRSIPVYRFRGQAATNFVVHPVLSTEIEVDLVLKYSDFVDQYREMANYISSPLLNQDTIKKCVGFLISVVGALNKVGDHIERQVTAVLEKLGPLTGL
jgi:hypothetical protein